MSTFYKVVPSSRQLGEITTSAALEALLAQKGFEATVIAESGGLDLPLFDVGPGDYLQATPPIKIADIYADVDGSPTPLFSSNGVSITQNISVMSGTSSNVWVNVASALTSSLTLGDICINSYTPFPESNSGLAYLGLPTDGLDTLLFRVNLGTGMVNVTIPAVKVTISRYDNVLGYVVADVIHMAEKTFASLSYGYTYLKINNGSTNKIVGITIDLDV
jgi:hypothetical protein